MRISTQLAVFFIAFNLFGGMMVGMGVAGDLGLNLETGSPDEIEQATEKDDVGLGNSVGGTLFGMYNTLTDQVGIIVNTIAPGFAMLKLFLPNAIVDPFAALAGVFVIVDLLSYARGTDL
ncbi:hypothetical protein Hbl1158_16990 (plasmid) [Halobaculum sp. CBA1158]|uniref:hypothetical protein n=1 Tax=Halobaculum sp. CBA1158 TaxID=2904243 RepID=UPI001F1D2F63|nr:hypothetical protein [Halobaculum sp. CBA1158]UIP01699.1 hypothetical protein Hbl1158_16990 [Halobaculum sp. CBA1158]